MRIRSLAVLTAFGLCAGMSTAHADSVTFSKGALIIPMNSVFQTECGMVSAYGLVYRILEANGKGHLNENTPVTVYIANNEGKKSPNRCIPTNKSTFQSGVGNQSSSGWNDGCDFSITVAAGSQPVVPVDFSTSWPAGNIFANGPLMTFDDSNAWPRYNPAQASIGTSSSSTTKLDAADGFTTINYSGAPFIIDAPDAPAVFNLLTNSSGDNGIIPREALKYFTCNNSSPLAETTSCVCSGMAGDQPNKNKNAAGTPGPGTTTVTIGGKNVDVSFGTHAIQIHQATTGFTANVSKRLYNPPPTFALFEAAGGTGVLEDFIQVSGLWLQGTSQLSGAAQDQDSAGCPTGNVSGCTNNGSDGGPNGAVHGVVYDEFQASDMALQSAQYPNGLINPDNTGDGGYSLFWSPHWKMGAATDGPSLQNLVAFWNRKYTAIMSQCHSIIGYENGEGGYGSSAAGTNFMFKSGFVNKSTVSGPNCSDPDNATATCTTYPNPGNLFAQTGDWKYVTVSGSMPGMGPGGNYQPGSSVMVTTGNGQDAFDLGQRDAKHAIVVYVAGHDVSGNPQGARIVLNSLLNLYSTPVSNERALAAPVVAYGRSDSTTKYGDEVLTPEYESLSGVINPATRTFDPKQLNLWMYPYQEGDFRAQDATALTAGQYNFDRFSLWDANFVGTPDGMGTGSGTPPPATRNLFTYFGGYPKANPTTLGGAPVPNGVLQWNWYPEAIDGDLLSNGCTVFGAVTSGCVDQVAFQQLLTTTATYDDGESNAGKGASLAIGQDGICDLQQAFAYSNLNSGDDWKGNCNAHNIKTFLTDEPNIVEMMQRVRGYCSTGVLAAPSSTRTDLLCVDPTLSNIENDNRSHLGGLVHSSPAVVGISPNIADNGAGRPTVAYVGGYDGELHAFYVGGGNGYTGPASTPHFAWNISSGPPVKDDDPDANGKFRKSWGGKSGSPFSPPAVGTELWAFMPATQLPHIADNSAQVDGSPVVMDVFADFGLSGTREWHTVLVDSVGTAGNELFAMDVTNPLHPRLLWDLVGGTYGSVQYSPTMILDDSYTATVNGYASCNPTGHSSPIPGKCVVPKWEKGVTHYVSYPGTDVAGGRTDSKAYDYQMLGGSRAMSIAEMRIGLEPYYMAFVTSNINSVKGKSGIEVYAIELSTGQKLWQWEKLYTDAGKTSNALPPPPTVIYGKDGASRILVGDLGGQLWELDALTGKNVNFTTDSSLGCSTASPCEYPAFDTQSTDANNQPITTNIAVAKIPQGIAKNLALSNYAGATVLVFGTAGADWITNPTTTAGKLHVVLYDQQRVPIFGLSGNEIDGKTAWTKADALATLSKTGVLQEVPGFPDTSFAAGERFYGNITVTASEAVFSTAMASIGNDINKVNANTTGKTYKLDLSAVASGGTSTAIGDNKQGANYGGLAAYVPSGGGAPVLVGSEVSKLNVITGKAASPDASLSPTKSSWTYRLRNWLLRFMQ